MDLQEHKNKLWSGSESTRKSVLTLNHNMINPNPAQEQ